MRHSLHLRFNTSIVSVESKELGNKLPGTTAFQYFNCIGGILVPNAKFIVINKFQYFNCIGGILINQALQATTIEFQYFNCIGGIHLSKNPPLIAFSFNTSIVSVECLQLKGFNENTNVSILQLYRWNKVYLSLSICLLLIRFNTSIVSVEYSLPCLILIG